MAKGYLICKGDKTTCGGVVQAGCSRVVIQEVDHAREGDPVTCGKDGDTYEISGGVSCVISNGLRMAGSLDSFSTCPCRARLIPSQHSAVYQSSAVAESPHVTVTGSDTENDASQTFIFAKSCVNVPFGSTDAGLAPELASNFGTLTLLASSGASGPLGLVAGTLGSQAGTWTVSELAAQAATRLGVVLLAFWPRDIGDSTLYTSEQLAAMRSASTRVRFQFRLDERGDLQIYGLHTRPGSGTDRVPVTQAQWNADKSAMVAELNGLTITWTPNSGPVVNAPSPYPGLPERLDNLLVHPIAPGPDTHLSHYPGPDATELTWQDAIIVFPVDSGGVPLYLVFSRPNYHKPPETLSAFPDAVWVRSKTAVQGGGSIRKRWKDAKGKIYEWDSQHGAVEMYNKQGKHLGEFDPVTGEQTKPANPGRRVEK